MNSRIARLAETKATPEGIGAQSVDGGGSLIDIDSVVATASEHASEVDKEARFPIESLEALRESGYLGLLVPAAYGGMGSGLRELVAVARRLAGACLSSAMVWAMHSQQVDVVVRHASMPLKDSLLPRIGSGSVYLASVTTGAGTGGDLRSVADEMTIRDGHISLKRFAPVVTGGAHADGFLVTMLDRDEGGTESVTLLYADRGDINIAEAGRWETLGMRGTESLALELDGQVPIDNVVGDRLGFSEVARDSMVPIGHIAWSACWLGAAEAAFERLIRHVRTEKSVDRESPLLRERLARVRTDLELVSGYLGRVVDKVDHIRAASGPLNEPSMQIQLNTLKIAAAELTFKAVDRMVQIGGLVFGYGTESPLALERAFRDLRSAELNFSNDRLLEINGTLILADRGVSLI